MNMMDQFHTFTTTNTQFIDFKDISTKCLLSTNHRKERKQSKWSSQQNAGWRKIQETPRGLQIINYVRKKRWRRNLQTKRDLRDISNSYNVWTLFGSWYKDYKKKKRKKKKIWHWLGKHEYWVHHVIKESLLITFRYINGIMIFLFFYESLSFSDTYYNIYELYVFAWAWRIF